MQLPLTPQVISSRPRSSAAALTACASSFEGAARRGVRDQLDREHRAETADVADRRPALLPGEHPRADRLADERGALDQTLLVDHVEHGEPRRQRDRIADVGPADAAALRGVHDLGAAEDAGERQPARDRLGDADQVRLDAGMLDREEAAGAAEPGLHLVDDEHDPVIVAEAADSGDELGRRDDEASLALNRFEDDRGDGLRGDDGRERALQRRERGLARDAAVLVRERHPVDLGREGPEPGLVRVHLRGEGEREQRPAVEAALERDHGRPRRCMRART